MAENEIVLLRRFSARADADAFAELVRRYVRLVYSTSWRVLKDEGDAADVTQETFFELTRHAGDLSGSLGSWLHRVATRKSIDLIRRSSHRRRREQTYAEMQPEAVHTWHDLSGYVDEALDNLDESMRSLLLEHFLAGKTTSEIAREQGTSQATVSRRISDGLERMRGMLRRQGLLVGAAALGLMLMENTSQAVPAIVLSELSKMTMVGTTSVAVGHGWIAVVAANADLAKVLLATAAVASVVTVAGYVHYSRSLPPVQQISPPLTANVQVSSPVTPAQRPRFGGVAVLPPPAGAVGAMAAGAPVPTTADQTVETALRPIPGPSPGGAMGIAMAGSMPVSHAVFRSVTETGVADLSTPEAAVYSLMALTGLEAIDRLGQCFAEGAEDSVGLPALRCLGYPVETIDAICEDDVARFTWRATVHRPFPLNGTVWSEGDSLTLTARLVRVDGLWKVSSISPLMPEESR
ncbi:MAG: sigma-70 family RNA polymerase sigma factor [Phycisphaerales bacterium]